MESLRFRSWKDFSLGWWNALASAWFPDVHHFENLTPWIQLRLGFRDRAWKPTNGHSRKLAQLSMTIFSKFWSRDHYPICIHGSPSRCFTCIAEQATPGRGGTPYVMGDTYVPRFWPPFFTLAGSSTIFLGYFSHPPTAKLSFGVQKLPIFTKIDLFGPKFNFFLDLFGSNFQRPAAHPHQFSGRVPPPGSHIGSCWHVFSGRAGLSFREHKRRNGEICPCSCSASKAMFY